MPLTTNTVTVDFDSDLSFAADSVTITNKLNDIPNAQITLIPRTDQEIAQLTSLDELLFSEVGITVKVNGQGDSLFRGTFGGAQTSSTASRVSLNALFYGGLYKMSQMSVSTPGFHPVGNNLNNMLITGIAQKISLFREIAQITATDNLVNTFKAICTKILERVTVLLNTAGSQGGIQTDFGQVPDAVADLYKLQGATGIQLLEQELDKVTAVSLSASVYELIKNEQIKDIIAQYATSHGTTFWSFFIRLCESYQVNLGTYKDQIYAIPNSPVSEPGMDISANDVQAVSVTPFPLHLPTRCYFSVRKKPGNHLAGAGNGMFPRLADAGKLTKLEEKLKTVNAIYYNAPAWALHGKDGKDQIAASGIAGTNNAADIDSAALKTLYDKFAQSYLVKETLKHRGATLDMKLATNIPVGAVVRFEDPFYKKKYQGYVTEVSHNISSNSVSTVVNLQYVVSDSEKSFLGLEGDGYTENPLYPNYKTSDLLSTLGL